MQQKAPQVVNNSRPELVDNVQGPIVKEQLVKKSSIGIARPRGSGATINLIDTMPGQLLPPPDGKKSRMMMHTQHFSGAQNMASPPTSPISKFSGNCQENSPGFDQKQVQGKFVTESVDSAHEKRDNDEADGFEPPRLAPRIEGLRIEQTLATGRDNTLGDDKTDLEHAAICRRNSSIRRGGRPRY